MHDALHIPWFGLEIIEIFPAFFNRRYDDKADANLDLDDFLVKAYAKQIKELNSSTGRPMYLEANNHLIVLTDMPNDQCSFFSK